MSAVKTFWSSFSKAALDSLYPPQCALCGRIGQPPVCASCESDMAPTPEGGDPPAPSHLSFRVSAYEYAGRAAQAVRRLKYDRATSLAAFMARAVLRTAEDRGLLPGRVVVPVPIHWTRRCVRGFNQSELLCEGFPRELRRSSLARVRATRPQVGLTAGERQRNLEGAFAATGSAAGLRIILVDDVVTSGHTAAACARALLEAGALEVGVLSFAGERQAAP